ncbi:ComF family protein, partial [Rhizobium ruizarguesonis]
EDNVRGAFAIAKGCENDIFGKLIVLVDDVYTTGATVEIRAFRKPAFEFMSIVTGERIEDQAATPPATAPAIFSTENSRPLLR